MKATLKFDLDNFDDKIAHSMCINSSNLSLVIYELDQWLRNQVKHNPDKKSEDVLTGYDTTRNRLRGIMEENSLTFENEIFN